MRRNKSSASLAKGTRPATASDAASRGPPRSQSFDRELSKQALVGAGEESSSGNARARKNWKKVKNIATWTLGPDKAPVGNAIRDAEATQTRKQQQQQQQQAGISSSGSSSNLLSTDSGGDRDSLKDTQPYPFDPRAADLISRWVPYVELHFDPRRSSAPLLMARIYDLSRALEATVMDKKHIENRLDEQEERFRRIEGERASRLHDVLKDMDALRAKHAALSKEIEALRGGAAEAERGAQTLAAHVSVQRASIERHVVRSRPPLSDVTVVFSEISGAKELWDTVPAATAERASSLHNDVLRYNLLQLGGYEVKCQRDAFLVAFDNPVDAVCWTAAVQLQLLSVDWPEEVLAHKRGDVQKDALTGRTTFRGPRVRMGVHTGMPKIVQRGQVVDERNYSPDAGPVDYVGHTVLRAGRIQAAAHPGQVLLSDTTKLSLRSYDAGTLEHLYFEDLGEYHLKNLRVPEKLHSALPRELRPRYFAPPVCDLPDPGASADAVAELRSHCEAHKEAIAKARALHDTWGSTAEALTTRMRVGLAEYTREPRELLRAAVAEVEQMRQLADKLEIRVAAGETAGRSYAERLVSMERTYARLDKTISQVPRLRDSLDEAERTNKGLLEAHRLDKEKHLSEVRGFARQIVEFRRQAENAKVLLRELKHWWRREQLDNNSGPGVRARSGTASQGVATK